MFFIQGLIIGFSWSAPIGMQNIYMFNNAVSNPRWRALAANFFVWLADVLLSLTAFFWHWLDNGKISVVEGIDNAARWTACYLDWVLNCPFSA